VPVNWESAEPTDTAPEALLPAAPAGAARFETIPPAALEAKQYAAWTKDFEQWLVRAERLTLFSAVSLKMTSLAGETERAFRIRLQQAAREAKDAAVQKLRNRYAPKVARLTQRLDTAQESVAREEQQAQQQKAQTAVSFGATVIGALFGRKAVSLSTLGRATTAARGVGRAMKETQDVQRAADKVAAAEAELKALEAELAEEVAALAATDMASLDLDTIEIKPKRGAVDVRLVALAWTPRA
jgi:hypothetical protein